MSSDNEFNVEPFQNSNTMLNLAQEIDKIFEEKLKKLETESGDGHNKQAFREKLLKDWIASLQTTNLDLITTYSELEREACHRLNLLSTKLAQSKQTSNPALIQQDLHTVLEVVRRVREEQSWSADGLEFQTISYEDVYGPPPIENSLTEVDSVLNVQPRSAPSKTMLDELERKNKEIGKLREDLESMIANEVEHREKQVIFAGSADVVERLNQVGVENEDLRNQLANCKSLLEEQDRKVRQYDDDKMALVAEISNKHDEALEHRNKITDLEASLRFLKMKLDKKEETIGQLNKEMQKSELSSCCSCSGSVSGSKFASSMCPERLNDDKLCTIFAATDSQHEKSSENQFPSSNSNSTASLPGSPTDSSTSCSFHSSKQSLIGAESRQMLREMIEILPSDMKIAEAVNEVKRELSGLIVQIKEKDQHLDEERKYVQTLRQELSESVNEIEKLQKELKTQKFKFNFIEVELIKMKKFYENVTPQKGGENRMRDSISNTLLNSQFEKSLSKISSQEFQEEERMIEPIRCTLDNLSQRVVSLEQLNRELEGVVKFWHEKANINQEKNELILVELERLEASSGQCEVCKKKSETCVNAPSLSKKISIESLSVDPASTSSDDQVSPVQNLMKDLKQEIEAKDLLLKGKGDTITCLESEIDERDRLIRDLRRRTEQDEENQKASNDMVLHLQNAVAAHSDSVKILMQEKSEMEKDLQSLREKLQALDESTAKLSDEKRQLENEVNSSKKIIEELNLNASSLSDQLSDCYNENMYKEKQLMQLKDANIELRAHIYKLQQDHQVMSDILKFESHKRQRNESKSNQLKALQEEYEEFQEQTKEIRNSIVKSEKELKELAQLRQKCVDMDIAHAEAVSNQQAKYGKIVGQLHSDINRLQREIDRLHEEQSRAASLLRDGNEREAALRILEDKNDSLQKLLESYENKFLAMEQEVGKLEFQNKTLTTDLTKLEEEIQEKEKKIQQIRDAKGGSNEKARSLVKRPSTAFAESQFNDLHRRLSQKSVEASKSMETLKRRTQEFEKQKKQVLEENKRLMDDAIVLVDSNSELRNKINVLELHLEQVKKELERRNEKLRISESRELDRLNEMERFSQQLEDMRKNEIRLRNRNDILSEEIENHKQSHNKRDQNTLNELKQAHRTIKEKNVELSQLDENIAGLTEINQILSLENTKLKSETSDLKEQLAVIDGRKESVSDLLKSTQEQSILLQKEIQRLAVLKTELEQTKQELAAMKAQHAILQDKHTNLQVAHKHLIENYERLSETRKFAVDVLKVGKNLKSERMKREAANETKMKSLSKSIRTLLADRQSLVNQVQDLHRDNTILVDKLESFYRYHERFNNIYTEYPPQNNPSSQWSGRRTTEFSNLSASVNYSKSQPELHEADSLSDMIEVTTTKIQAKRKNWERNLRHSAAY